MKKSKNKILSLFLAALMVITAVPFASILSSVEASAASSATYAEEYYYPAGTAFVTDLAVSRREYSGWAGGRQDDCKRYLTNAGWTLFGINCNDGKKCDYIHIGYKKGTDESQAIRAFAYYNGSDKPDTFTYTINGHACTFHLVTNGYNNSSSLSNTAIDLNTDAGGDYIFLYYTKDPNAGPPITSTDHDENSTNNSDNSAQIPGVWLNTGGEKGQAGKVADLNAGAGGAYIYTFYGQTGTSVDTDALHNAINSGDSYLANSGRYTSASVSALQTAVNNAKTIVNDYNADGLSGSYDQTKIDNAQSAITNAINALQTNVYLNANGGSIGTSSFAVTVGTDSGAKVSLSSYVPTRTGYTFKGWSTSSTATSGSTGDVNVGFNTTLYATWEANKYIVNFDNGLYTSTVTYGGTYGTLPAPEKAGHTFLGWFKADGSQLNGSDAVEANDVYVTSKWETNKYTIKWVRASGRETIDVLEYGTKITAPANTVSGFDSEEHYSYSWSPAVSEYVTGDVTYTEIKTTEKHTLGALEVLLQPTCTTDGLKVQHCTICENIIVNEPIPATGHSGDFATDKDATCTADGVESRICTVCGVKEERVIPALGHKAGEVVVENNVDPTCTEKGHYDNVVYCTVCEEELSCKTVEVDALGHKYGKVVTDPTCTDKGFTTYTCSVCGDTYVADYVDALGHQYDKDVTDPTCTDKGYTTYTCSVCGDKYVADYVDALGHKEETTTVDATCTVDGSITVKCTVCGETISTETIPATGHTMGDWEVTEYPTFDAEGEKVKSCAKCDYTETEVLKPVKLRTTRIISSEIKGNTISVVGYTNADSIGFYRTTAAGEDIIFDMYYDEEDLANEPTPIKYGDNSPRWIIYNSRWAQYAVDGKYTDKLTIAGVEYNFEVTMNSRELEANDVVLVEKFTNINVDNENKVITLIPPKGTESITLKQTSREYDEFTYTIDADNYDNVTLNEVSGAYRGSYTISANGEFETEITVTVNKNKYCQEDYTLKVIFIDFDLVSELKPLRGAVSLETYEDGREYLKVTMADGQTSTGIYKEGKDKVITDVKVELDNGTMTEKDNLYVGYAKSNKVNPTGKVTISLSNGSVLTYDIVFDMGITETEVDPLSELKLIRSTASFDEDGTLRITRNAGLAQSAGAGFYAVTTAGETVTFTTEQGTVYSGRTDAFIAYLTQNTSNVKGKISYTLSDGTAASYNAVIDLGLGDEYVEPEEPVYDLATDLRAIRGTVSVEENTVTIKVASGKTMTGIYNTTTSGATVEIVTENGVFAERDDAYVAYKAYNSSNVEGTMTVTFADGTTQEYTVIFDLGL